ncbi:hypothetical protein [Kamptonema sp. UHCC 0994]|uniref:hypothetical protein n=1 Tax=Kamptonema sp. UHCC 0994 TaxID=3031329 RepID=UPI0023B959C2|nr:hypothetical protein [Kamptonema sp. UHCC 0994]MDF0554862.1 hypothetical protein [Kamptonema sp. UHCC 0994]
MSTNLGILVASVLTTLGLAGGGFLIYQKLESKQAKDLSYYQSQVKNSNVNTQSNQSPAVQNQADSSVQPAFGGKATIKILSVYRLQGKPDEVTVEMRIGRIAENNVEASDIIDPGAIEARNPNTSETYTAVDPFQGASNPISLLEMRPEERVNAYVALKVPSGMNAIDIFIPNAMPFRNIPIAASNSTASSVPSATPKPTESKIVAVPSKKVKFATNSQVIKPGKFVNLAYGNKAQVELLSVKRIQDPQTGKPDVVNVQMRIRRLTEDRGFVESLSVSSTTARDRKTSQVYKSLGGEQSTGNVFLGEIATGASADAYVWLRVPEGVNAIDIYVPQTKAFQNVAIAD